ncbi:MAG: hypothetical protein HUJ87_14825 [Fusobacterium varium]|uniref:hypothetical protein n=1 Tax=Fusobacterium varium TaxID=856 RepID=UPI00242C70EF|nr:hypothetical protein [Fusobacterium varium]MCF0171765.1 hypothetical protein [Fusobacterium varium]
MDKNKIIKKALLELGFPYADSDIEEAESYKTASFLFDGVLYNILRDDNCRFNIKEERLRKDDVQLYEKKISYVKPKGYIMSLSSDIEEHGDKLLSPKNNFVLRYLEQTDLTHIPQNFERILVLSLAAEIAAPLNKEDKLSTVYSLLERENLRNRKDVAFPILNLSDLGDDN